MSDWKRDYTAGKAGAETFHRILSGTVHQDETFEVKRGKIGCGAFKSIFTGMPQVKSADDGADGNIRMAKRSSRFRLEVASFGDILALVALSVSVWQFRLRKRSPISRTGRCASNPWKQSCTS